MHPLELPTEIVERMRVRRGRLHLFDRLEPARTALVVIDMQNAFCDRARLQRRRLPGKSCPTSIGLHMRCALVVAWLLTRRALSSRRGLTHGPCSLITWSTRIFRRPSCRL